MKQFCRVDEVADMLGVTEQTIRNWIREGTIEARRFGRPHLIPIEEAARLLGKPVAETSAILERRVLGVKLSDLVVESPGNMELASLPA